MSPFPQISDAAFTVFSSIEGFDIHDIRPNYDFTWSNATNNSERMMADAAIASLHPSQLARIDPSRLDHIRPDIPFADYLHAKLVHHQDLDKAIAALEQQVLVLKTQQTEVEGWIAKRFIPVANALARADRISAGKQEAEALIAQVCTSSDYCDTAGELSDTSSDLGSEFSLFNLPQTAVQIQDGSAEHPILVHPSPPSSVSSTPSLVPQSLSSSPQLSIPSTDSSLANQLCNFTFHAQLPTGPRPSTRRARRRPAPNSQTTLPGRKFGPIRVRAKRHGRCHWCHTAGHWVHDHMSYQCLVCREKAPGHYSSNCPTRYGKRDVARWRRQYLDD